MARTWWQRIFGLRDAPQPQMVQATPAPSGRASSFNPRAVAGGRVTMDNPGDAWLGTSWVIDPPEDYEDEWRLGNFDAKTLDKVSPTRLVEILSDLSPEVSRALWDFLLLCNPGWTVTATRPGGKTKYPAAQKALDAFLKTLGQRHGTVDVVFAGIFMGAFWRGAMLTEIVLDEMGRMPLDIVVVDPHCIRFKKVIDPILGAVWQLGQWQGGEWVSLDLPTICHVPIHPALGRAPYGRPMMSPALFTALFLLSMLHDLKRVVQQQGYPRLDISIDLEKLVSEFPEVEGDPAKYQAWADQLVSMVTQVYSRLEPDDAYVHTSTVTVNRPVGTVDASSLGAVDALIKANERMATRALKTMPLMMGLDQSTNETDSNRQWEIFAAGIKSVQHFAETSLSRQLTLAMECQGIQAEVDFKFAELRAAEELRDEQTRTMRISNTRAEYDNGWISQEEAAEKAVGHTPDEPAPRNAGGTGQPQPVLDNGDGQERKDPSAIEDFEKRVIDGVITRMGEIMAVEQRVKITPDGADEPLLSVPDTVTITDSDADRAIAEWDRLMPDYVGILNATVVGQQHFDNNARANGDSVWSWDQGSKRYRSSDTGRFIGQKQMTELRDEFVAAKRGSAQTLASDLATGSSSIQEFEVAFRREIKTVFVDQYVLARGGRNAMTQADWGMVGRMVRDQYGFAHSLTVDIANGTLSQAQIASRVTGYFNSSTTSFERGRSASYGMPSLPAYPADGGTACRHNCRCTWSIEETDDAWNCTWRVGSGENCADCASHATEWAPLVVPKASARSLADVERILSEVNTNGHH